MTKPRGGEWGVWKDGAWCQDRAWIDEIEKAKYVRCPTCNKRLMAQTVPDPCGGPSIRFRIPPHKRRIKRPKRKKTRHERSTR